MQGSYKGENMIRVNIKKQFSCKKEILWDVVTNNKNYEWRSDLSKIDIVDETHFIEYTKKNYPTFFTITNKKEGEIYQFELENTNIKGRWSGVFRETSEGVELDFTEEIEENSFLMKVLLNIYLKKQQKLYMKDLEKEIIKR